VYFNTYIHLLEFTLFGTSRYIELTIPDIARNCCHLQNIEVAFEAHPAFSTVDKWGFFLGVKRPERELDHSYSCIVEAEKGAKSLFPLYACMVWAQIFCDLERQHPSYKAWQD
jgi:hypothetical protein